MRDVIVLIPDHCLSICLIVSCMIAKKMEDVRLRLWSCPVSKICGKMDVPVSCR